MEVNREQAWALLTEYTQSPNLIKHALAVEAAMRAYARRLGEDSGAWGGCWSARGGRGSLAYGLQTQRLVGRRDRVARALVTRSEALT